MTRHLFLTAIAVAIALLLGKASQSSDGNSDAEPPPAATAVMPPSGVIMIDENVWVRLADEPADHLQRAVAAAEDGKHEAAADEIEKASAFVYAAAGLLGYRHKTALHDSAEELDRLARDLRDDRLDSNAMLIEAFARAQFALAAHHLAQADRILKSHDAPSLAKPADQEKRNAKHSSTAGLYLQAAADHLEGSAKWRDGDVDEAAGKTIRQMRNLADKLIACDVSIADATERLGVLDKRIVALGRQQESPQSASKAGSNERR